MMSNGIREAGIVALGLRPLLSPVIGMNLQVECFLSPVLV